MAADATSSTLTNSEYSSEKQPPKHLSMARDGSMSALAIFQAVAEGLVDPGEFVLFSLLPIELRLKIWKETFVPAEITLGREKMFQTECQFPIALWVNKEAREEAMNNYVFVLPDNASRAELGSVGMYYRPHRRLAINPKIDSLSIDFDIAMISYDWFGRDGPESWAMALAEREPQPPRWLKDIRRLTLTNTWLKGDFSDEGFWTAWKGPTRTIQFHAKAYKKLLRLSGLEELHLTVLAGDRIYPAQTAEDFCCTIVKEFLEHHREVYVRGIPKVSATIKPIEWNWFM